MWVYDKTNDVWHERGQDAFVPHKNVPPTSQFTFSASNSAVSFDGTHSFDSDGTIASYAWDFGDGGISVLPTPQHTYTRAGTYTVLLTVKDNEGAIGSRSQNITVTDAVPTGPTDPGNPTPVPNRQPSASFSYVTGGDADPYRLSVDASNSKDTDGFIIKYHWDFGNGVTYDTTNAISNGFYYTADGTYTVVLTVTDDDGATASASQIVTVKKPVVAPPPNQSPGPKITATTNNLAVAVDGSGSTDPDGTIVAYGWTFGDGTAQVSGVTQNHTYAQAGSYTITLAVRDDDGAVSSVTKVVTVTAPPVVTPPSSGGGYNTGNPAGGPGGAQPSGSDITPYQSLSGATVSAKISSATGKKVSLPATTLTWSDFANAIEGSNTAHSGSGLLTRNASQILGAGIDKTFLQMNQGTTSKNTQVGGTTRLQYWNLLTSTLVQDLTVTGVPINSGSYISGSPAQVSDSIPKTHNIYNGIYVNSIDNFTMRRVKVKGVPGSYYAPPGETFPISSYRGSNHLYEDIIVDGHSDIENANVSSSGLSINFTRNVTMRRYLGINQPYGICSAVYGGTGTFIAEYCHYKDSRAGLNLEANLFDIAYIRNCKWENIAGAEMDWWGSTTQVAGNRSFRVEIHDPIVIRGGQSGQKLRIRCPATYGGTVNTMHREDIHVFVGGVEQPQANFVQWV